MSCSISTLLTIGLMSIVSLVAGAATLSNDSGMVLWNDAASLNASSIESRQPGGIFITTDINWGGTTGYAKQPYDLCIVLKSPWLRTISSFGPDADNAAVFYSDTGCSSSDTYTIFNPGSGDLRTIGWNDRIGSFRVRQLPDTACIADVDDSRYPGVDCTRCCNGCSRSGTSCCPSGAFC